MITGSKELIRDINTRLVLETIVNTGPVSRAGLSKKLGLTKATISTIAQILIDHNLIIEIGSAETEKGRRPILLEFNYKSGHVISLDISLEHITVLTCDLKGTHCRLKQYKNTAMGIAILPVLKEILEKTIAKLPDVIHGVIGISIGVHGIVHDNKTAFTPYYSLDEIDLSKELSDHFNIPVFIENEANLSVLGERTFYFNYPNIINISVHSGVGMGILLNDKLYRGNHGYAGEFGHSIIVPDGRPCPCGNQGCMEQYASERALLMELSEKKKCSGMDIQDFLNLYYEKDPDVLELIERFVFYMGIGINNVLNIFNPDLIVLNCSFTIYIPDIIQRIQDTLNNRMNEQCHLLPSRLQDTAILLGGVCVALKHFLGIDTLNLPPSSLPTQRSL